MRSLILVLLLATPCFGDCVVFFHSEHCAPCKASEPAVWKVAGEFNRIIWVDVDKQPEVARNYHVTRIPCFVAVYEGPYYNCEVGRLTGQVNAAQLRALCNFPLAATIGRNCRQLIQAAAGVPPW